MSETSSGFQNRWRGDFLKLKAASPEIAGAFGAFHHSVMKDGALSKRDKELIALAIGVAKGCDDCIFLHADGATKAGATREQILEAAGVAVMMEGGPAFVHLPTVIGALEPSQSAAK